MTDAWETATTGGARTIGEEPKPRVLLCWFGPDGARVARALDRHAPTLKAVPNLSGVRQDDYDVLVTNDMRRASASFGHISYEPEPHLFVISFSGPDSAQEEGEADFSEIPRYMTVHWSCGYLSKAIDVPDPILPAAADLVLDDLLPAVLARESHIFFKKVLRRDTRRPPPTPATLHPFLLTSGQDPRVLAGWYQRSDVSEGWFLPSDVHRPWDWAAAAIQHWARTYRTFPLVGGWSDDPQWQTAAEAAAVQARTALKTELAATTARLEAEIAGATAVLEDVQRSAAGGPRRLLTEKGDPLKEAVAAALAQLGYSVIDRDLELALDGAGKIEDLGVVDPDDAKVDPIIEVKGYNAGARVSDIGQMMRHLVRAAAGGRSPSAIWWVANHSRSMPPDSRPLILANENAMVQDHAAEEVPLVIIDTRHVFRAIQAVEQGTATSDQVRASLRTARGRWEGTP